MTWIGSSDVELFTLMVYNVICSLEPEQSGDLINENGKLWSIQ